VAATREHSRYARRPRRLLTNTASPAPTTWRFRASSTSTTRRSWSTPLTGRGGRTNSGCVRKNVRIAAWNAASAKPGPRRATAGVRDRRVAGEGPGSFYSRRNVDECEGCPGLGGETATGGCDIGCAGGAYETDDQIAFLKQQLNIRPHLLRTE
jgi:hypothetical protein